MPPDIKSLLKWAVYYANCHSIIAPLLHKIAVFPITDLIYEEDDEETVKETRLLCEDTLDIKSTLYNTRLDLLATGNSFSSIHFPRLKWITCESCSKESPLDNCTDWKYKNFKFVGTCPHCKTSVSFSCKERSIKDPKRLNIIRWSAQNIELIYDPISGACQYFYSIPNKTVRAVAAGDKNIIRNLPLEFMRAIKEDKAIELDKDNIFHMRRAGLAEDDQGWGKPVILAAMKTAFQTQILRKANEAIALQYVKPWTILYPQPTKDINVQTDVDLSSWQTNLRDEFLKFRDDDNRVSVMSFPVGQEQVYGNAKALLITPELKAAQEEIIISMGYPPEFVFGGLQYSGSTISLRIIETQFLREREQHRRQVNFYLHRIQRFMGRRVVRVRFSDLKMADDVQTRELMARMVMSQQMALGPFLQELGKNPEENNKALLKETEFQNQLMLIKSKAQAEAQGESQLIMMRKQLIGQREQMEAQKKMQTAQGIDALRGMLSAQQDQAAEAAQQQQDQSAQAQSKVQTNVSRHMTEGMAKEKQQQAQAVTSGQPPAKTASALHALMADYLLKGGEVRKLAQSIADMAAAMVPGIGKQQELAKDRNRKAGVLTPLPATTVTLPHQLPGLPHA